MKQLSCPLCTAAPIASAPHLAVVQCPQCGLGWTLISEEIESESLYEDEMYQLVDNRSSPFERLILREARLVLEKVQRLLGESSRRLLDFGCGKGQFPLQAKHMGWTATGVETAAARAEFARSKYGLEVINEFYECGQLGEGQYDLITLNHVLEHLPEPTVLLAELLEHNLRAGGVLVIEVPRLDSWQSRIGGVDWIHLDIPRHLTHWTEDRLVRALGELGYMPIARRKFSIHLGVLGMLQALAVNTGYRDNIITALKGKKSFGLLIRIALLLPLAFLLESLSTLFNKSGIVCLFFASEDGR